MALPENRLQLRSVCGDHFLLLFGGFDDYRNLIVIAVDQGLTTLKLGNGTNLCSSQLQNVFNILGFILLQIQNDLILGVINDRPSVLI